MKLPTNRPGFFHRLLATAFSLAHMLPTGHAQSIDPNLKPSVPTKEQISRVDYSLADYERITLKVSGQPFFFNGIQLRADKIRDVWGVAPEQIADYYQQVADDGFTVVNTQVLWSEIQPDAVFEASESTFIQGGTAGGQNFEQSTSHKIGYKRGSEISKKLSYFKFDFSGFNGNVDAAKVRFYVDGDSIGSKAFPATLYGITNNNWKASSITWNSGAPNHNGVDIAGTLNQDYFVASKSPSWDPILNKAFYDFDATDFVAKHAPGKVASFILQASTADQGYEVGASIHGARGANPPQLVISDKNHYDWSYIDRLIGWAEDAGIKLEFVWFGSDSTSVTMDSRVPYFVFKYTKMEKVNDDGSHSVVFSKNTDPAYGVYWHLMDKNDLELRALEKTTIKNLMNHVAEYNTAGGNKRTVIGVDVANEPAIHKLHGTSFTAWQNPKTFGALGKFASLQDFRDRTMWEFCLNLANAVKESNYPVWTRSNDVRGVDARHVSYNEARRQDVGTSLDFIGLDPYSDSFSALFNFGHTTAFDGKNYASGKNLPMVMENGGQYTTTDGLITATLAGGGYYNVYDFMSTDPHGMYVPTNQAGGDFTAKPRGSYVTTVRNTNKMLRKIGQDLATKLPKGAGGKNLDWLNIYWNDGDVDTAFGAVTINYKPTNNRYVGISDIRNRRGVALLSTGTADYTLRGVRPYGVNSVERGYYNGASWVREGAVSYQSNGDDITFRIGAYECVLVVVNRDV